jgi:hypothetical protein
MTSMHPGSEDDSQLDESLSAESSEELYERLNLRIDKGQEPMRIVKFLFG